MISQYTIVILLGLQMTAYCFATCCMLIRRKYQTQEHKAFIIAYIAFAFILITVIVTSATSTVFRNYDETLPLVGTTVVFKWLSLNFS